MATETRTTTVGQFVTNFSALPYIRAQQVKVFLAGLRPSTRHYVYFDRVDVNALCAPAIVNTSSSVTENSFIITGERGSTLSTNTKGELSFVFDLPANSFFVGEREIFVCDANLLTSQDAISSSASGKFNAYSYSIESSSLTINTIVPVVSQTVPSSSTSTVGGFTQSGVSYWGSTQIAADGTSYTDPGGSIGPDGTASNTVGITGAEAASADASAATSTAAIGSVDASVAAAADATSTADGVGTGVGADGVGNGVGDGTGGVY